MFTGLLARSKHVVGECELESMKQQEVSRSSGKVEVRRKPQRHGTNEEGSTNGFSGVRDESSYCTHLGVGL